jgi:hypothetical protein
MVLPESSLIWMPFAQAGTDLSKISLRKSIFVVAIQRT